MSSRSSDETYLESFIDSISSLPAEVRRNMELMKDLDQSASVLFEELSRRQHEYVQRVEEKILNLQVVENGTKVRVLGSSTGDDDTRPAVIPTTEELMELVKEPETLRHISRLEQDVLQRAEEKVAIANQTYKLVENIRRRLDYDLQELETYLKESGEFQKSQPGGAAKPNDLAAINVVPGSPDWILAKVMTHDPMTGMYKLSDEDIESNKIFTLPESQVVLLGGLKNLSRGDIVYAVYPDTTSFYQATIVQGPRKVTGGGSFVMVHFIDDGDEHGITHDKAVLLHHVMLPPYGVTLQ